MCFVVQVKGSDKRWQVRRCMLNASWKAALKAWDEKVAAAARKKPVHGADFSSPGESPAESKLARLKKADLARRMRK